MITKAKAVTAKPFLWKDKNHSHFWIENGVLYESYNTIRGLRYRTRLIVKMPDCEFVTKEMIKTIEEKYLA